MTRTVGIICCCLLVMLGRATADPPSADEPTYLLRYKFEPGETLRWKVVHRVRINTTVSGTTQTAETTSDSVKLWKVLPSTKEGTFSFEHSVEKVDMRQKLTGREEVAYNSETDPAPPLGFEDAAKNVGVPLTVVTIDAQGNVVDRQRKRTMPSDSEGQIVIPLPAEAVAVGHVWSFPYDVQVTLRSGESRQIKTRQRFTLEEITGDIASIRVETQVLTPVQDPEIEAQLIQRETKGVVRFDMAAGRIVDQRMDLDRSVLGFSGDSSSLHYVMRFTEELLPTTAATAGPATPSTTPKTATAPAPKTDAPAAAGAQAARPQTAPSRPAAGNNRPSGTGNYRRR